MIGSWGAVALIIHCKKEKLDYLKSRNIFISFTHVGSKDVTGGYGWRMMMKAIAVKVIDRCRGCGYAADENEERYRKENDVPFQHRHSWGKTEKVKGEIISSSREEIEQFIDKMYNNEQD